MKDEERTFAERVLRELSDLWVFGESLRKAHPLNEGKETPSTLRESRRIEKDSFREKK